MRPPDPDTMPALEMVHETADQKVLDAGFHMGATYFELRAFIDAVRANEPPAVDVQDGLLAVAMGVAAHRSIDEGRVIPMSEVLSSTACTLAPASGAGSSMGSVTLVAAAGAMALALVVLRTRWGTRL